MNVGATPYRSIWPIGDDAVGIVDQTRLPHTFATRTVTRSEDMIAAIQTMAVRGAPLIGVAGAYGLALAMRDERKRRTPCCRLPTPKCSAPNGSEPALGT